MVLETGICVIQCSWLVRYWGKIREARREGKSYDEFVSGEDGGGEKRGGVSRRRDVGPRDWREMFSLSAMYAAMNRRHGEGMSVDAAEKGSTSFLERKEESVVTTIATGESPHYPAPVYAPCNSPKRGSKNDIDVPASSSE